MLRTAAQFGLKPSEVYEMTYRELELFVEGQTEARTWFLETMAWVQANLINVHVPRGKPRVTAEQLLPRKRRKTKEEDLDSVKQSLDDEFAPLDGATQSAKDRLDTVKAKARASADKKDYEAFMASKEGRRLAEILGRE